MELKIFEFIDEVMDYLDGLEEELDVAAVEIEKQFEELLVMSNVGFSNINSRVKSTDSLKEKILRNNYYKRFNTSEDLIANLSDLIGVRIECRFVDDENRIYEVLKKHFNKVYEDGSYFNSNNNNIRLFLSGKQPQKQKNGFKIYRIDGIFNYKNMKLNFELQIKSLVNLFWGEIEHKIIYKNNNYMVWDGFFKDILSSIKKNLSMIDQQLLIIDSQFNKLNAIDPNVRKTELEKTLSKMIHDIFSSKMRDSIGFVIDFRKSCDTIMKYIFRSNEAQNLQDYNTTLIKTHSRLNEITNNEVDFDSELKFERDIILEDKFSRSMADMILESINTDFQWNTFFRILFEIELGNNAEDFETFIGFIKDRFVSNKSLDELCNHFGKEDAQKIIDCLMMEIVRGFKEIDDIMFIYDNNIENINRSLEYAVDLICTNISSFYTWERDKDIYLGLFYFKLLSIFDYDVEMTQVRNFVRKVKSSQSIVEIKPLIIEYIDNLDELKEIKAEKVMNFFKVN